MEITNSHNIIQIIPETQISQSGFGKNSIDGWLILTENSLIHLSFLESKQISLYEQPDYDYSDLVSSYSAQDLEIDSKNEKNFIIPFENISDISGVYKKSGFLSKMSFIPSSFLQIKSNGKTYIFAKFSKFTDSKSSGLMGGVGRQYTFESFDWKNIESKI